MTAVDAAAVMTAVQTGLVFPELENIQKSSLKSQKLLDNSCNDIDLPY